MEDDPVIPEKTTTREVGVLEEFEVSIIQRYHVILLDDNHHTYDYVIEMLMDLFGHSAGTALNMATEVDRKGRVIVTTTHKERAELKRDQIMTYGADWRIPQSAGSMSAMIEPAG